jgi:hypothetical protein
MDVDAHRAADSGNDDGWRDGFRARARYKSVFGLSISTDS